MLKETKNDIIRYANQIRISIYIKLYMAANGTVEHRGSYVVLVTLDAGTNDIYANDESFHGYRRDKPKKILITIAVYP